MRITLEPTVTVSSSAVTRNPSPKVSIEYPDDDMDLSTVITDLVQPALMGWGFHPSSVMEALNPDYWKQYNGEIDCGKEEQSNLDLDKNNWNVYEKT
jgi:hypothetical protein